MSVTDDGQGVPSTEVERRFFAARPHMHALELLRRRLKGLFGRSFSLEARSEVGQGTIVTLRIPLRPRSKVAEKPLKAPQEISLDCAQSDQSVNSLA